jgi:hypothetical protein
MPNILEQISGLCDSRYTSDPRTNQRFVQHQENCWQEPGSACNRLVSTVMTCECAVLARNRRDDSSMPFEPVELV